MHKLDKITVSKLKSEQVIVDVPSAIKELIENAIDGGADSIWITLENYGLTKLTVQDNGNGMTMDQLLMCSLPHTTSKIKDYEDINSSENYGFRGEALSSLANVADELEIVSRTSSQDVAYCLKYNKNGKPQEDSVSTQAMTKGTKITAKSIFKDLPVRLKVTKEDKTVTKRLNHIVLEYCLIHPKMRFSMKNPPNNPLIKGQVTNHISAISLLFGPPLADELFEINQEIKDGPFEWSFHAIIPSKESLDASICARSTDERIFMYLNHRPVEFKHVHKIIINAWRDFFQQRSKYPFIFLHIVLPPNTFDINLNSNKRKVMLNDEDHIVDKIKTVITAYYQKTDKNIGLVSPKSENTVVQCHKSPTSPTQTKTKDTLKQTQLTLSPCAKSQSQKSMNKKSKDNSSDDDDSSSSSDFELGKTSPSSPKDDKRKKRALDISRDENNEKGEKEKKKKKKKKKNDSDSSSSSSEKEKESQHTKKKKKLDQVSNDLDELFDTNFENLKTRMTQHSQMILDQQTSQTSKNGEAVPLISEIKKLHVVGQILPSTRYVVTNGNSLCFFNQTRAKEALLYDELLVKFKPQTWAQLESQILISESEINKVCLKENRSEFDALLMYNFVQEYLEEKVDFFERNGFKLVKSADKSILIAAVYAKIPNYNLTHFVDLLIHLIKNTKEKGIFDDKLRAKPIQNHVAEIAKLNAYKLDLDRITKPDLQKLIDQLSTAECPHGKPIFEEFYDLTNLKKFQRNNMDCENEENNDDANNNIQDEQTKDTNDANNNQTNI
jgi:DNA mismatch repair protein MutL